MAKDYIISVDLGGTKVLTALLNKRKQIIKRVKIGTDLNKGKAFLVKTIAESIESLMEKSRKTEADIKAICLGVPGTVNPNTGVIGNAPNLRIKNYNIKKALQEYFSIPVLIENDVNLAGLGIKEFEFKNRAKNMLVVFVGTGIGGALIFDGKLYRGSSYFAGEIGHMLISPKGLINAGKKNLSFEGAASRPAIVRAIRKDIRNNKKSILKNHVLFRKPLKSKALLNALRKKDKVVTRHLDSASTIIGMVLGSITTLLNIDTIVLGGGVIEAMHVFMLPKIKAAFKKAALKEPGKIVKIVATKLGDDAPLYGGAALADEFLKV